MVNLTYSDSLDIVYTEGEVQHVYNPADISWVLTSSALVMIMLPGVGYLYSGLLRRKNALSFIFLSLAVYAVASFQWWFWGYSLTYAESSGPFIGNFKNFAFINVSGQPSPGSDRIPALAFAIYQNMFAAITPMLLLGAMSERGRIAPALVFTFVWNTLVYCPIAHWTWSSNGWLHKLGALDFAGGGPVHMAAGSGSVAYALWLGKRKGFGTTALAYRPANTTFVVLGTVFLWFGWMGFNGGSALAANLKAVSAIVNTNLSASVAGITWMCLDWRLGHKWSAIGFCSGVIAGCAAVTPAAGFVGSPAALAIGFLAGALCNFATRIKVYMGSDDPTDCFAIHGVGGAVGSICTAIFASRDVSTWDGSAPIPAGWISKNWSQLAKQLAECGSILSYSFVVTLAIVILMDFIPGLSLRVSENGEYAGIDEDQIGEQGYDFVQIRPNPMELPTLTQVQTPIRFDEHRETSNEK